MPSLASFSMIGPPWCQACETIRSCSFSMIAYLCETSLGMTSLSYLQIVGAIIPRSIDYAKLGTLPALC